QHGDARLRCEGRGESGGARHLRAGLVGDGEPGGLEAVVGAGAPGAGAVGDVLAVAEVDDVELRGLGHDGEWDAGKTLSSITFLNPISNANYPNSTPATGSGFAIIAATLAGVSTGPACYANCDH